MAEFDMGVKKTFGEAIDSLRLGRHLSKTELAARLDRSFKSVSKDLRSDVPQMHAQTYRDYARIFEITPDELDAMWEAPAPVPPNTRSVPLPIPIADTLGRWGVAQVARLVEAVEAQGGPGEAVERLEGTAGPLPIESAALAKLRRAALLRGQSLDKLADAVLGEAEKAARPRSGRGAAMKVEKSPVKRKEEDGNGK